MAGLSLENANKKLEKVTTVQELVDILQEISVYSSGSPTVLYSGMSSRSEKEVLETCRSDDTVRMLDKTVAAKFLNHTENAVLVNALDRIFSQNDPGFDFYEAVKDKNSPLCKFLFGTGENNGWNIVSRRFVEETKGEVVVLTGEKASSDRIFFQTEWPVVKKNKNIAMINGVESESFISRIEPMTTSDLCVKHFQNETAIRIKAVSDLGIRAIGLSLGQISVLSAEENSDRTVVAKNKEGRTGAAREREGDAIQQRKPEQTKKDMSLAAVLRDKIAKKKV
ncbi:MAG: hypothetical protein CSA19_01450, partial [Deltaproteobacteria bacterium]